MTKIEEKYNFLLENVVNLGAPIGEEESLPDGGSKQVYQFGVIYFHPRVGTAFECHGLILEAYISLGEQSSGLGYPITDEIDDPNVAGGRMNVFERGVLTYDPAIGVTPQFDNNDIIVPQVVLKITDTLPLTLDQGMVLDLDQIAAMLGLLPGNPFIEAVRLIFPDLVFRRLYESLTTTEIQDLVAEAQQNDPTYEPPLFNNYLVIDCPPDFDTEVLVDALNSWTGVVDFAYTMPVPSDPVIVGTSNPFFVGQGYLGPATTGIGVQAAWAKGADGSNTRFVDLEQGWFLGHHEDLPSNIPLLGGINSTKSFSHGTAVLGEIVGIDNNLGIVGIAPKALPRVISYFDPAEPFGSKRLRITVASRILATTRSLRFGDVLQLEVQIDGRIDNIRTDVPVETDPGIFEAIRLITRLGIIVVEAAGNGNANLDHFRDVKGRAVLARNNLTEFKDSGAIMVGACTSFVSPSVPHTRGPDSNFGSRVDCCAWGENILTTGNPANSTQRNGYRTDFGGTSGATAIITGICLLVQNLQILLQPRPGQLGTLGPYKMREILRKDQNTTFVSTTDGFVARMPDMLKILANEYVNP